MKEDKKTKIWLRLMRLGAAMGCHQMPERSFFYKGYQFPLCARCTGILAGYFLGILIYCLFSTNIKIGVILCIPMAIDGITQYLKMRTSTQWLRLTTGILGGIGIMLIQLQECSIIWRYINEMS
ncbi:MAG: DUF2085 domain-containing protein [Clostridia bacterium]|nr:DUF2085 domain-containing protein [Clostridia bacterium]MDY5554869.1 DUF2085 domain-containing protein [Blautia sp.]